MTTEGNSLDSDESAEREAGRQRLLDFLRSDEPAWKYEDHPDIAAFGTAEWVRRLRCEKCDRQREIERLFSES
jgi:hypothetical protein